MFTNKDDRTVEQLLKEFADEFNPMLGAPTPDPVPIKDPGGDQVHVQTPVQAPVKYEPTLGGLLGRITDSNVEVSDTPMEINGVQYYVAYFSNAQAVELPADVLQELGFAAVASSPDMTNLMNYYGMEQAWLGADNTFVAQFKDGYIILPSVSVRSFDWKSEKIPELVLPLTSQAKRTAKKNHG